MRLLIVRFVLGLSNDSCSFAPSSIFRLPVLRLFWKSIRVHPQLQTMSDSPWIIPTFGVRTLPRAASTRRSFWVFVHTTELSLPGSYWSEPPTHFKAVEKLGGVEVLGDFVWDLDETKVEESTRCEWWGVLIKRVGSGCRSPARRRASMSG